MGESGRNSRVRWRIWTWNRDWWNLDVADYLCPREGLDEVGTGMVPGCSR